MGRNDAKSSGRYILQLKVARNVVAIDKDIAAGVYVYAVEEFGKLLLLEKLAVLDGMRRVMYKDGFVNHNKKFKTAFDYFQANGYDACLVISEGWFVVSDVAWDIIERRLLAETQLDFPSFILISPTMTSKTYSLKDHQTST